MQYDNPKDFVFALVKYTAYAVPGHPVCYQIHIAHKDGNLDADGDPLLAPSLPKGVHRHHSGCYHIEDMPENPMRVIDLFIDLGYGWNEEFQKEQEFGRILVSSDQLSMINDQWTNPPFHHLYHSPFTNPPIHNFPCTIKKRKNSCKLFPF